MVYVLAVVIGMALMVVEVLCSRQSTVYQARNKAGTDHDKTNNFSIHILHQWHWPDVVVRKIRKNVLS